MDVIELDITNLISDFFYLHNIKEKDSVSSLKKNNMDTTTKKEQGKMKDVEIYDNWQLLNSGFKFSNHVYSQLLNPTDWHIL